MADRIAFPKSAGLYKAPFPSEPDPYFFFTYEAFEQRLETLRRLLRSGQELTLIVGERGSGKTTLLQRFLATSNGDWKTYRLRLPGEQPETEPEIHPAYMVRAPAMRLIVDDAHLLRRHSLRLLIRRALANASGAGMQLILIAEPAIEKDVIATVRAIDSEKAVNRLYMPRLTTEEAEEYLRHRLTMAGYSGPGLFSPGEIRKLHSTSGGLPGRLNAEAQQHLQKGWRQLRGKSFDLIRKLRSGIGLTGLIIFLSAGLFLAEGLQSTPPGRRDTANLSVRSRISVPAAANDPAPAQPDAGASVMPHVPRPSTGPFPEPAPFPQSDDRFEAAVSKRGTRSNAIGPATETEGTRQAAIQREGWLQQRNPDDYTIQILAVGREDSLLEFVGRHQLARERTIAYYRTEYRGSPRYPLLYGVYRNRRDAEAGLDTLPAQLRTMSPWIRKMGAVQRTIQRQSIQ